MLIILFLTLTEDRMLIIFWIPILLGESLAFPLLVTWRNCLLFSFFLTVAIAWALYSTFPTVLSFVKHYVPLDSITN